MLLKFTCNECEKSGTIHERCDKYFEIKAINDKHRETKHDGYNEYKQTVYDKAQRVSW